MPDGERRRGCEDQANHNREVYDSSVRQQSGYEFCLKMSDNEVFICYVSQDQI